jgi:uncharacterized small protein (DUF1192 family)
MIGQEVAALNAEVKLAESVIAGKQSKTKATTSPKVSSPVTANPPKPPVVKTSEAKVESQITQTLSTKPESITSDLISTAKKEMISGKTSDATLQAIRLAFKEAKDAGRNQDKEAYKKAGIEYAAVHKRSTPTSPINSENKPATINPSSSVEVKPHEVKSEVSTEPTPLPEGSSASTIDPAKPQDLMEARRTQVVYGDTTGNLDNGTLRDLVKDGNKSAQAELDRRYINEAFLDFKEWATPNEDHDLQETIGNLEYLAATIERHEKYNPSGKRKEFLDQIKNRLVQLESNRLENNSTEVQINESTPEEITDSLASNVEELSVAEIEEAIAKFDQEIAELNTEIDEAEKILNCFQLSKG